MTLQNVLRSPDSGSNKNERTCILQVNMRILDDDLVLLAWSMSSRTRSESLGIDYHACIRQCVRRARASGPSTLLA